MKRLLLLVLAFAGTWTASAQSSESSLRVFLDCQFYCDDDFITEELPIVDFVSERTQSDVHVLGTQEFTASGGNTVTLQFIGRRAYAAMADTIAYSTSGDATDNQQREALRKHITIGLTIYMAKAGLSDKLVISAVKPTGEESAAASIETDPWNYWVFRVSGRGFFRKQASTSFTNRNLNINANRTTDELKLWVSVFGFENRQEFDTGEETIVSSRNSSGAYAQLVKSLGAQWSAGGTVEAGRSSFQNTQLAIEVGPAIEYDVFPYSESTRRLLTIQYGVVFEQRAYDELTIFALEDESLIRHYLESSLNLSQKWGSLSVSANLSHLLTNFDRSLTEYYNLDLWGNADIRLFRGLSFNTWINYSRIRNQIDLRADAATVDEILLQAVQLPTGYEFSINFGLTYRFGSIYNNVVNPRMD